jgi:hypothetical protein
MTRRASEVTRVEALVRELLPGILCVASRIRIAMTAADGVSVVRTLRWAREI